MIDVKYEYGCEITSTSECPLRKEIRADAIDECIEVFKNIPRHYYREELLNELEKLKEQNNES